MEEDKRKNFLFAAGGMAVFAIIGGVFAGPIGAGVAAVVGFGLAIVLL